MTATSSAKLAEVDRSRTAAATAARRQQKSQRLIAELVPRLPGMDRAMLAALVIVVVEEIERRGAAQPVEITPDRRPGSLDKP